MSKLSRFFIIVIIAGLAFITGVRWYRAYEQKAEQEAAEESIGTTFQNVPVQWGPAEIENSVLQPLPTYEKEVFLEDKLNPQQQQQQAQQTIASILSDYKENPPIKAFHQDMQEATGQEDLTLEQLSSGNIGAILQQYPQLQQVLTKHVQDPEFSKTLQEIFNNPQFVESVKTLQGNINALENDKNKK